MGCASKSRHKAHMGASRYMSALWFYPNMVSECGVLGSAYGAFAGGLRWLGSVRDGLASGILSDHSENRAISKTTLALRLAYWRIS